MSLLGRADEKFWYFATLSSQYCSSEDQKKDKGRAEIFQNKIVLAFFSFFTSDHLASLELRAQVSESFLNYIDDATINIQSLQKESPLSDTVFQSSHNIKTVLDKMLDQAFSL